MSKDILVNVDILRDHPKRINNLVDRILKEIEKLRSEGYELYTLTIQKRNDCVKQIDMLSNEFKMNKLSEHANQYNSIEYCFKDSQEQDFYSAESKEKYELLEDRLQRYAQCKNVLEDSAKQVVSVNKTADDLKQKSELWNNVYTTTIDALIELA